MINNNNKIVDNTSYKNKDKLKMKGNNKKTKTTTMK
jgi:hypothetical protein